MEMRQQTGKLIFRTHFSMFSSDSSAKSFDKTHLINTSPLVSPQLLLPPSKDCSQEKPTRIPNELMILPGDHRTPFEDKSSPFGKLRINQGQFGVDFILTCRIRWPYMHIWSHMSAHIIIALIKMMIMTTSIIHIVKWATVEIYSFSQVRHQISEGVHCDPEHSGSLR